MTELRTLIAEQKKANEVLPAAAARAPRPTEAVVIGLRKVEADGGRMLRVAARRTLWRQAATGSGWPTSEEAGMPNVISRRIIGIVSGRLPFSTSYTR